MFEIKVQVDLEGLQETLKDSILKEIKNYNIWDNEGLTLKVESFFEKLTMEILDEKKEEIKKEVEEAIKENAVDIALEALYENLNKN